VTKNRPKAIMTKNEISPVITKEITKNLLDNF